MSGATLETRVVGGAATRAFRQLAGMMRDTTPVMRAIGTGLVEGTHTRFGQGVDPDGNAWAPLNPVYAAGKRGNGILRESGMSGGLMGSITFAAGRDQVRVGTNKIYAAIHQFGGTIRPVSASHLVFPMGGGYATVESVTIPARPFLGVSQQDVRMMEELITDRLERAMTPAA